jgi:hypothetical protein
MAAVLVLALLVPVQEKTGTIAGRVSPEASVRVVAKLAGTDASKPENVKAEAKLEKGGEFLLKDLPPGKYELLFQLQGDDARKYVVSLWGEIVVEAGKGVEGIGCRLTPADAPHEVDALMVSFRAGTADADCVRAIESLGCRVKRRTPKQPRYLVDLPDEKSVEELIPAFQALAGVELAEPNFIRRIK